jgi:hypothetical protein
MTLTDTQNKRQFILDTLLPYKQDRNLCGYEGEDCMYLTLDGRMCAVGKHMREGEWQYSSDTIKHLVNTYTMSTILTENAVQVGLTLDEWELLQNYHDNLARGHGVHWAVSNLEKVTNLKFPELYADISD